MMNNDTKTPADNPTASMRVRGERVEGRGGKGKKKEEERSEREARTHNISAHKPTP